MVLHYILLLLGFICHLCTLINIMLYRQLYHTVADVCNAAGSVILNENTCYDYNIKVRHKNQ